MSRSKQVSLPLSKAVFSVKVKCCNAHHKIELTDEGSLRLCDHQDDMDAIEGMLLLNPLFRCRCVEVRDWWRVYLAGTKFEQDGGESSQGIYPDPMPEWMREAMEFTNDYGDRAYREPTHRFAFYQLPKGLRPYAEEAMDIKRVRREQRWSGADGELTRMVEMGRWDVHAHAAEHGLAYPEKWAKLLNRGGWGIANNLKRTQAEKYVAKHFARLVKDCSVNIIGQVQLTDSHGRMLLSYGMKLPFHREALAEGIVPLSGPPLASLLESPRFDAELGPYLFEAGELTRYPHGSGSTHQTIESYKTEHFTATRSDDGHWVFTKLEKGRRLYNFPTHN